ncbi:MAG TPA: hypothetical protein VKB34_13550 [Povalibacter sp.]|nr:hypothetical protein [Povalibacter sp.]
MRILIATIALCCCQTAAAENPPAAVPAPDAVPAPVVITSLAANELPAMNFVCTLARNEMFDAIKLNAVFGRLDKELYGSPITLRITHTLQPTAGGKAAGLLSAIWSGGTLGLLPLVTSNNFIVRYDVRVQGRDIATYSYQRTFTRAVNIWSDDKTYGLGEDGLAWLKSTARQFADDIARDPKVADLQREYAFYFGS